MIFVGFPKETVNFNRHNEDATCATCRFLKRYKKLFSLYKTTCRTCRGSFFASSRWGIHKFSSAVTLWHPMQALCCPFWHLCKPCVASVAAHADPWWREYVILAGGWPAGAKKRCAILWAPVFRIARAFVFSVASCRPGNELEVKLCRLLLGSTQI